MGDTVSIIVPVYNAERYLPRLISSLRGQTYADIQIIFVEDGSQDQSAMILDEAANRDSRIRVLHQKNQGTARARNAGMRAASGRYLMFVDDDDLIPKRYVERFVREMEQRPSDLIIGGYRRVGEDGRILFTRRLKPDRDLSGWQRFVQIAPWGKIYRRKFVEECGAKFLPYKYGEDIYFQMQLYARKPGVSFSDSVDYCWVLRKSSVSNTLHKGIHSEADIFPMLDAVVDVYGEKDQLFRYFVYRHCVYQILISGRTATPKRLLREFGRCRKWLKKNECLLSMSPFSSKLEGELLRDRCAVAGVWLIARLHLERVFAKVYGR